MSTRFSTFNASLNRSNEGELITDLSTPNNEQAQNVAEIIQRVNPDVLLMNEFDFDADGEAAQLFQQNYLGVSQNGADPVEYPFVYLAPSNTGIPSGFDFNNDGEIGGPNDAFGFGFFPGQFGMVLFSKFPIVEENVRTFQTFLWQDMPGALLPDDPTTAEPADWYSPEELEVFRLSSKSHWDIPINVDGEIIHVLASHPTPPVFDPEDVDFNGRRNHDEIRFWADYITPGQGSYIYDDAGNFGGLTPGERFVIVGDQNADPFDGDSTDNAARQLTENPQINTNVTPDSEGGIDAADRQGEANLEHEGNPAFDTADFADTTPGNLRVDYVLPSQNLEITEAGVFWPPEDDPLFPLVGNFDPNLQPTGFPSSDHRLVWADVEAEETEPNRDRKTVAGVEFLGEVTFETGFTFNDTEVGGLSGITYDPFNEVYYSISDDRSQNAPARFYTLSIEIEDGDLEEDDITFEEVTFLLNEDDELFPENGIDPEAIALTGMGTLAISSEGDANQLLDPFVNLFSLQGEQFQELPVPDKFLPTADGTSGIRNNLAFESLTLTPDERFLYTATENALIQDGPAADLEDESPSRILQYDFATGEPLREFLYFTDPVPEPPTSPDGFSTNGLVELLALDNNGTLLALERSFSEGVGNSIRLYEVLLQGATDISDFEGLINPEEGEPFDVDQEAQKRLLLDFGELGLTLDNIEGMALGPQLPDGQQSLVVVSDNNFNADNQFTQFLAFGLDITTIPAVEPTLEVPPLLRFDPDDPEVETNDADDPAIYVHPTDSSESIVISTLKNGGLIVYDLEGQPLQAIAPDDIRYNNVDLVYGFQLGEERADLAVVSDRRNDTLVIYQIDPDTRQLTDITAPDILETIFGVDDGEQTAYGLATYVSPTSGKSYAFVTQADGNQVAQLELIDNGNGGVDAELVRTLELPVPTGDPEDSQSEGLVVDRELGSLYVALEEEVGILKFDAEPDAGDDFTVVQELNADFLQPDIEGLTIYYGEDGTGYLIASSQGDSTFAVFEREGDNEYLGSFVVGESNGIDGVEESDGLDIINVGLGDQFPSGLLVVHDGSNEPATILQDPEDGEIQNFDTNFKFIAWEDVANAFEDPLVVDTESYDPRDIVPSGDDDDDDDDVIGDDDDDDDGVSPTLSLVANDLFNIGSAGTQLLVNLIGRDTEVVSEVGIYGVDDEAGSIDGLQPGDEGYIEAALSRGQVVFSVLPDALGSENPSRLLSGFDEGTLVGFYLVRNGTTDSVLAGQTDPSEVVFASPDFNSAEMDYLDIQEADDSAFELGWRNVAEGEFDDIEIELQAVSQQEELPIGAGLQGGQQAELLDLTGLDETQPLQINFTLNSEAAFDNFVGFYTVDNPDGSIGEFNPGDEGYATAAIEQTVLEVDLQDSRFVEGSLLFDGGVYLAPYIIANGTREEFLETNPSNQVDGGTVAYFAYLEANPDAEDHVILLGNNVWGFEDLLELGDRDYNDIVFEVTVDVI